MSTKITPLPIRIVGDVLIVLGAFSIVLSVIEFYIAPLGLAIAIFIGNIILLLCFIGLRLRRRWSVYLFSGITGFSLIIYFISLCLGLGPDLGRVAAASVIPLIYFSTVFLNWRHFE